MWKYILLAAGIMAILFFLFRKTSGAMFNLIFLGAGLLIGILATYLLVKGWGKQDVTNTNVTTVSERIERVFKVVTAEGYFSEVYNYENTEHLLSFIPSTKKALIMANAKVLMGFDFKKLKWEYDAETKKLRILEFPQPEILSIEPDLKYYNLENGLFNKFDEKDLTKLQADAQLKLKEAAMQSELPATAQKQMKLLFTELVKLQQLQLEGAEKISAKSLLISPTRN